ncbi:hypothetical protein E2C01_018212 [Portunus trituberculatus]|uniref:Uncharacterized protein n=1 Tax=Portunus trituberculatus TaxID=210409 RepID=A0A5B7DTX8_PORTR|nr:hypothetical protein [Portunus trituberculatus]
MTPRTVPAVQHQFVLLMLMPEMTEVATQVKLRGIQADTEVAQAEEAQELNTEFTSNSSPSEPKEGLWCSKKVNIDGGGHAMNNDHLLLGIGVRWGQDEAEEALHHQHGCISPRIGCQSWPAARQTSWLSRGETVKVWSSEMASTLLFFLKAGDATGGSGGAQDQASVAMFYSKRLLDEPRTTKEDKQKPAKTEQHTSLPLQAGETNISLTPQAGEI